VKISKPQSFQLPVLSTNSKVQIKIKDVRSLRNDILQALKKVVYQAAFARCFDAVQAHGTSFQQFILEAATEPKKRKSTTTPTEIATAVAVLPHSTDRSSHFRSGSRLPRRRKRA
jgi:hypothetical protein